MRKLLRRILNQDSGVVHEMVPNSSIASPKSRYEDIICFSNCMRGVSRFLDKFHH